MDLRQFNKSHSQPDVSREKTKELKNRTVDFILEIMAGNDQAKKEKFALALIKSRLFDESINASIRTEAVNLTVKKYEDDVQE